VVGADCDGAREKEFEKRWSERSDREVKTKIKFDRNETEKEIEKFGSFLKSFIPGNVCLFVWFV